MTMDLINEILHIIQLGALVLHSCTEKSRKDFKDQIEVVLEMMGDEEEAEWE